MRWALLLALGVLVAAPAGAAHEESGGPDPGSDLVSLDFDAIELGQAIQFILRGRDSVRYVTGEPLREKVSVKFTDIHWRHALESLLKAHDYATVEEGEVLRVVRTATGDATATRRTPLLLRLKHAAGDEVRDFLQPMLSPEGQILTLDTSETGGGTLSIVDVPEVLQVIRDLLPSIDVPKQEGKGAITRNDDGTFDIVLENYPRSAIAGLLNRELGLNIYVSGTLPGSIDLDLESVRWENALTLILRDAGHAWRLEDGVIIIGDAQKSQGEVISRQFRLRFIDAWDLLPYLEKLLSAEGKVSCFSPSPRGGFAFGTKISEDKRSTQVEEDREARRSRILTVTDRADIVGAIAERIAELDIMPRQVEVDVKIVQITRDESTQRGIDWNLVLSVSGMSRPNTLPFGPNGDKFFPPVPDPTGGFTYGALAADQLTAVLRLIDEDDRAEVLSEPNITTLDNIEASILVGQKFPLTRETIDPQTAVRTVTLDRYEDIGIQLVVVPSIAEGNRIHMIIHPAVSTLGELIENRFPVINTREADTQLLLRSGETAVIGGLVEKSHDVHERRVPFFGSIPLLGWFFRYKAESEAVTELVILVTPRIVLDAAEFEQSLLIGDERRELLEELRRRFEALLEP